MHQLLATAVHYIICEIEPQTSMQSSKCNHACAFLAASDLQAQGAHGITTTASRSNFLSLVTEGSGAPGRGCHGDGGDDGALQEADPRILQQPGCLG